MLKCNRGDLSFYIEIISSQCVSEVLSSDVIGGDQDLIVVIGNLQLAQ